MSYHGGVPLPTADVYRGLMSTSGRRRVVITGLGAVTTPPEGRLDLVARGAGDAPELLELGHHALPQIAETAMSTAIAA